MIPPHNNPTDFKYAAFISYKSDDSQWAKWLQRRLERYRIPSILQKKIPTKDKRLGRCFIYHNDILPNQLLPELERNLNSSRWLIVICSKAAAHSQWVGEEIDLFVSMGRKDRIIPFIIDGTPYSRNPDEECLPNALRRHFPHTDDPHTTKEILGANINEEKGGGKRIRKERALIQIIALLLGIEFDTLWKRHRRYLIRQLSLACLATVTFILLLCLTWYCNRPFDASIQLVNQERAPLLNPLTNFALEIDINEKDKRHMKLPNTGQNLVLKDLPAKARGKMMRIRVSQEDCIPVDTLVPISHEIALPIRRNHKRFGHIDLTLAYESGSPLRNQQVLLENTPLMTDEDGRIHAEIPLNEQKTSYTLFYGGSSYQITMPHRSSDVKFLSN